MRKNIIHILLSSFGVLIISLNHTQQIMALSINELFTSKPEIVEVLKLNVPSSLRKDWIDSEKESWEPWLKSQQGFLGRQLFWNKDTEEAILLIGWESRAKWKSIPQSEIEIVQNTFVNIARFKTGIKEGNPFPLTYEGELLPQ